MRREALTCPPEIARGIEGALARRGAPVERIAPCVWSFRGKDGPVTVVVEVWDELPRLRVELPGRIRLGFLEPGWERWLESAVEVGSS